MPIERHLLSVAGETSYRLKPNPDAPVEDGFKSGAVLEWSDDGTKWKDYFFIDPKSYADLENMFREIQK